MRCRLKHPPEQAIRWRFAASTARSFPRSSSYKLWFWCNLAHKLSHNYTASTSDSDWVDTEPCHRNNHLEGGPVDR
jgi:hypothetical protein